MGSQLGMKAKLYYKVGGIAGGGSWLELTNIRDVTFNLETDEADVTVRGNLGWRATEPTLSEGSVEFEMIWDSAHAGFQAVKDAYFNRAIIGFRVLDENGEGLEADYKITNLSRNEPLTEAITASVTAKIAYSANPPTWIS